MNQADFSAIQQAAQGGLGKAADLIPLAESSTARSRIPSVRCPYGLPALPWPA